MLNKLLKKEKPSTRIDDMIDDLEILDLSTEMHQYSSLQLLSQRVANARTETMVALVGHRMELHKLPVNFTPESFTHHHREDAIRRIGLATEALEEKKQKSANRLETKAHVAAQHIGETRERFAEALNHILEDHDKGDADFTIKVKKFLVEPDMWELYSTLSQLKFKTLVGEDADKLTLLDEELFGTRLYENALKVWWDETGDHRVSDDEVVEYVGKAKTLDARFARNMEYGQWSRHFKDIDSEQKLALFKLVFKIKKTHEKMLDTVASIINQVYSGR